MTIIVFCYWKSWHITPHLQHFECSKSRSKAIEDLFELHSKLPHWIKKVFFTSTSFQHQKTNPSFTWTSLPITWLKKHQDEPNNVERTRRSVRVCGRYLLWLLDRRLWIRWMLWLSCWWIGSRQSLLGMCCWCDLDLWITACLSLHIFLWCTKDESSGRRLASTDDEDTHQGLPTMVFLLSMLSMWPVSYATQIVGWRHEQGKMPYGWWYWLYIMPFSIVQTHIVSSTNYGKGIMMVHSAVQEDVPVCQSPSSLEPTEKW